ncbi:MAG: hypothetical protein Fur0021_29760 [Candidatus Promineifilaceae bacterium]
MRQHSLLTLHLLILLAAELLAVEDGFWVCTPQFFAWLTASYQEQLERLAAAWATDSSRQAAFERAKLAALATIERVAFAQQQLDRLLLQPEPAWQTATWLGDDGIEGGWRLQLPAFLLPEILFHLLQMGEWQPDRIIRVTGVTMGKAWQQGYNLTFVRYLLRAATNEPLSAAQGETLLAWYGRADRYQLRTVKLLSTRQPQEMADILGNARLRQYVSEQIGPRHAIVSPEMEAPLRRWVEKKGFPLHTATKTREEMAWDDMAGYAWLGMRVLTLLKAVSPHMPGPPARMWEELQAALTPLQQTAVAQAAEAIMEDVREAIRGKDAFLPATTAVPEEWLEIIRRAIESEGVLNTVYQSLGEQVPRFRCLQPLWLEQRGALYYLHAYCYRTERELVFRVDRFTEIYEGKDEVSGLMLTNC